MFQLWRQQPFAPGLTLVRETSLVVGGKVAIFSVLDKPCHNQRRTTRRLSIM